MKLRQAGYTIVEVTIVMAVTAFLLIAAELALKDQTNNTAFEQSLRDLQSKIVNTVRDVNNSLFPNAPDYDCTLVTGGDGVERPKLHNNPQSYIGGNQDCLFLGKAIQVIPGQSTLYIYSVLGRRTYTDPDGDRVEAATFAQTNPTAADSGGEDLTESYTPTAGGLTLKWAHYDRSNSDEIDIAGFYNDLAGSGGTDQQLLTNAYRITSNASNPKAGVDNCIERAGCNTQPLKHWLLCYQGAGNEPTALLDISASLSGVTSQLKLKQSC